MEAKDHCNPIMTIALMPRPHYKKCYSFSLVTVAVKCMEQNPVITTKVGANHS